MSRSAAAQIAEPRAAGATQIIAPETAAKAARRRHRCAIYGRGSCSRERPNTPAEVIAHLAADIPTNCVLMAIPS